jgi:hypothetical protein
MNVFPAGGNRVKVKAKFGRSHGRPTFICIGGDVMKTSDEILAMLDTKGIAITDLIGDMAEDISKDSYDEATYRPRIQAARKFLNELKRMDDRDLRLLATMVSDLLSDVEYQAKDRTSRKARKLRDKSKKMAQKIGVLFSKIVMKGVDTSGV